MSPTLTPLGCQRSQFGKAWAAFWRRVLGMRVMLQDNGPGSHYLIVRKHWLSVGSLVISDSDLERIATRLWYWPEDKQYRILSRKGTRIGFMLTIPAHLVAEAKILLSKRASELPHDHTRAPYPSS